MARQFAAVYLEKVAYVGEPALTNLIVEGVETARDLKAPSARGEALMSVLMFAFGHGCHDDPLYPWIANTIRDGMVPEPARWPVRLEKKAITCRGTCWVTCRGEAEHGTPPGTDRSQRQVRGELRRFGGRRVVRLPALLREDDGGAMKTIFPSASAAKITGVTNAFNSAFEKFELNRCLRKAHFFAQIRQEVGASISALTEDLHYSEAG
ncbi:hypothetical protein OV079_51390 [Nannocystis pusilla]|uniref:Uncharacterized protein n=1 Tax=Nannocystis pusilla TaxID=889268 RepID=A0A9X3J2G8_9BACT|nr:hypothetical protein [Nannocystis pusilla]MCY1013797.1 hypothetical protein [Nannocystis pusilla]